MQTGAKTCFNMTDKLSFYRLDKLADKHVAALYS